MTRVVIIGAGSQFGGKLSRDILAFPALQEGTTIALCDTDPEKLARVTRYVQRIVDGHPLPTRLECMSKLAYGPVKGLKSASADF